MSALVFVFVINTGGVGVSGGVDVVDNVGVAVDDDVGFGVDVDGDVDVTISLMLCMLTLKLVFG
jgi:hypothetical protein